MRKFIFILVLGLLTPEAQSSDFQKFVEANLPTHGPVTSINWQGKCYWIKKIDRKKTGFLAETFKKIVTWVSPDPILLQTALYNDQLLKTESRRLKECMVKGGNCTRLALEGPAWIVTEHSGRSLEYVIKERPLQERFALLKKGLLAVKRLHHKGVVHGRASIRDMTIDEAGHISFIDMAEDPEAFMSKEDARARDLINYFRSAIWALKDSPELMEEFTRYFTSEFPKELTPILHRVIKRLKYLGEFCYYLPTFFGKDLQRFGIAVHCLRKTKTIKGTENS